MGRSGEWVCQVARYFRWVRKVGWVGSWYGLVEILKLNSRPLINQSHTRVVLELLGQLKTRIYKTFYKKRKTM